MAEPAVKVDDDDAPKNRTFMPGDDGYAAAVLSWNADDEQMLCNFTLICRLSGIEHHVELRPEDKEVLAGKIAEIEQELRTPWRTRPEVVEEHFAEWITKVKAKSKVALKPFLRRF